MLTVTRGFNIFTNCLRPRNKFSLIKVLFSLCIHVYRYNIFTNCLRPRNKFSLIKVLFSLCIHVYRYLQMTLIVTKSNEKLSSANSFKKQRKDATFVKFRTEKPIQGDREGLKKCRGVTSVPPGVFFVS